MRECMPGPQGEPLFGDSRTYADDPLRFAEALEEAYGDLAQFELGSLETVAVMQPELIERVLVSDADQYCKPEFQRDALGTLIGEGLLLSESEQWETQRKLASPAFEMARLAAFDDQIVSHTRSVVSDWTAGDEIDIQAAMTQVTIDVILDLMMGVELPTATVTAIREQIAPIAARFEPDPIRFATPDWVPMPGDRTYEAAVDELEAVLDRIIERRRGAIGSEEDGPMDFLSILLRARDRGEQDRAQLRDELMTMLLAGHDTTALTLTFTWVLLSEHPDVEARLYREIDEVVGDEDPSMDHLQELDYLEWVLNEAMRLYPPVYTLFRTATTPVELGGYELPEGTNLMLPQWAVHRSDRYWDEPETFDPDRFSPERIQDRHSFRFFPFGGGKRHCIGKHLALLEAKLIVLTVAGEYWLEYSGELPLALQPTLTTHPSEAPTVTVKRR